MRELSGEFGVFLYSKQVATELFRPKHRIKLVLSLLCAVQFETVFPLTKVTNQFLVTQANRIRLYGESLIPNEHSDPWNLQTGKIQFSYKAMSFVV